MHRGPLNIGFNGSFCFQNRAFLAAPKPFLSVEKAFSNVEKAFPSSAKAFLNAGKAFPFSEKVFPLAAKAFLSLEKAFCDAGKAFLLTEKVLGRAKTVGTGGAGQLVAGFTVRAAATAEALNREAPFFSLSASNGEKANGRELSP